MIVHAQYFWYPPSSWKLMCLPPTQEPQMSEGKMGHLRACQHNTGISYPPLHRPCISAWHEVWIEGSPSQCLQQTPHSSVDVVVYPQVICQSPCYRDIDNWLPHRNNHSAQFPITVQRSLCQVLPQSQHCMVALRVSLTDVPPKNHQFVSWQGNMARDIDDW